MKQSANRYKIGDMIKVTNRRVDSFNHPINERWPENTVCVVMDTSYIDGAEDNFVKCMAIDGNDGKLTYNYYIDEVSPYPSNADMIAKMTDCELAEFILDWLRSPYSADNGK